jgi:adenosylhomocysteinase
MNRIADINRNFPIAQHLTEHLKTSGNLHNVNIAWHCHLTDLTAIAVQSLIAAGCRVTLSECNSDTTEAESVDYMRTLGAKVFIGDASPMRALAEAPKLLSDTGFVLIDQALNDRAEVFAASEITTSGITRLRARTDVNLPVVNVNDGHLKNMIENYHGVGEGLIDALNRATGRMWAGRRAVVVGYGRVGAGAAEYLRRAGAIVSVCESSPIRRLSAHYDGFLVGDLRHCLPGASLVVTATGQRSMIDAKELELLSDGVYLFNVGHWADEINREALINNSVDVDSVGDYLEQFRQSDGRSIFLATHGSPANVAMNSGSPEPTLIHLTTEMLSLDYLAGCLKNKRSLPPGEMPVPQSVEEAASLLALRALSLP